MIRGESFRVTIKRSSYNSARNQNLHISIPSGMSECKDLFKRIRYLFKTERRLRVGLYSSSTLLSRHVGEKLKDLLGFSTNSLNHGDYKSKNIFWVRAASKFMCIAILSPPLSWVILGIYSERIHSSQRT
ncbi:hypothetical protein AVEN_111470-1 [Araneus ventricosus]|uniref:Uncharacterized protein n=1 Tax=Araneus ventricosus TaxID=182803 RepID=A0A4Y2NBK0_ARAVE|nr:hypothetical protein AVEN_111470-1 [Araneus ventricosus]